VPVDDEVEQPVGGQLAPFAVQLHRIRGQEQVRLVAVQLRPLRRGERIFNGQRVQAELLAHLGELGVGGSHDVEPDDRLRVDQAVGDLLDREVLALQHAVAVKPGTRYTISVDRSWARRALFRFDGAILTGGSHRS